MIAKTLACATVLCLVLGAGAARADDDWAGFYVGIDALDGSIDRMSIVPVGRDNFEIRTSVTKHSMCSGAGTIVATGQAERNRLVRRDVVVRCDGADKPIPVKDSAYSLHDDDILSLEASDDGRMLYFHRISDD